LVTALTCAALLALSVVAPAMAAPGDLDPSFGTGTGGIVSGPAGSLNAVTLDSSGRIVLAGSAYPDNVFIVARRLADGSPDPSFADGGQTRFAVAEVSNPRVQAVASASDGSVFLLGVGLGGSRAFVAKLTAGGALDPAFGTGGVATLDRTWQGSDMALAPDGGVFVSLESLGTAAVVRLTSAGALDGSWGSGGWFLTRFGDPLGGLANGHVGGLAALPDGGVLLGGMTHKGHSALTKITASGTLDTTFGVGGSSVLPVPAEGIVGRPLRKPDGSYIAIAGDGVIHISPSGVPDPTFGIGGLAPLPALASFGDFASLALASDGSLVLAGTSGIPLIPPPAAPVAPYLGPPLTQQVIYPPAPPADAGVVVARLTPSGAFDCSFGNYGRVVIGRPGGGRAGADAVTVDNQDRAITVGGENPQAADASFAGQFVTRTLGGAGVPPAPASPLVYTQNIDNATTTGATLHGWVDPHCADTTWSFDYGPTTAYGSTSPAQTLDGRGGPARVELALPKLGPGIYHYRLVAQNATGRTEGADASFRVPAPLRIDVAPRRIVVKHDRVRLRLSCHNGPCRGSVTLMHARTQIAATKAFTAGQQSIVVSMHLNGPGHRLLRRHGSVRARIEVFLYGETTPRARRQLFLRRQAPRHLGAPRSRRP
jgi:uncharacterized delta-60 repeat protein